MSGDAAAEVPATRDVDRSGDGSPPSRGGGWLRPWIAALALMAVTFLAYQPVWDAGYIWDDNVMLTGNRHVQAPDGLRAIWFSTELADYFPLTSTALWLQWRLWGPDPQGYHLVNVLLHALAAVLWWRVLRRLAVPGAWLAAAVFALHPVNVESVAWITEIKNTLAMAWFAVSVWAFVRWDALARADDRGSPSPGSGASRAWPWYVCSVVAFALALLSKTAVAPLPVVLLGLAWWRRGRITKSDLRASVPYFALSAVLALVTIWFHEHRALGGMVIRDDGFAARLAGAGWAVWFYAGKALLPVDLIFVYPRWQIDAGRMLSYLPLGLLVVASLAGWRLRHRWGRGPLFAAGCFVALLLPVLGFIDISYMRHSFVADRWQYFAIVAPIALVVAVFAAKLRSTPVGGVAGAVLLCGLGVLTWRQARMYVDVDTLWRTTLARNPGSAVALNEIGTGHSNRGELETAIAYYEKALAAQPDYGLAHHNYGCVLLRQGDLEGAIARFRTALSHHSLLQPAQYYLGRTLLQLGRVEEAVVELQKAIAMQKDFAEPYYHLGSARLQQGRLDEAAMLFESAIGLDPQSSPAYNDLGIVFIRQGRGDEALRCFERAAAADPNSAEAHNNVGRVLLQKGRHAEAAARYRAALKLEPENPDTLINLAWVLSAAADASVRNGDEAVEHAGRADRHTGGTEPYVLRVLAAAFAESGRFAQATQTAQRALALARERQDADLARTLQADLDRFARSVPLREAPNPVASP